MYRSFMSHFMLAWLAMMPMLALADRISADSIYKTQNYVDAARQYEEVLAKHPSSETYFNLGNAYYRLNDLPRAILNYERALRLSPTDADIRFNLALCQTKLPERFNPPSEMFFVTWARALALSLATTIWAWLGIGALLLAILCFAVYRFASRLWLRRCGFHAGVVMVVGVLLCNSCAAWQVYQYHSIQRGVVMKTTTVRASHGESAKSLRELHAGTTVMLTDSLDAYRSVTLPDGNEGWIEADAVEKI